MKKVTIIDINDIDPEVQRAALGDGLTYLERFRNGLLRWMPEDQVDALVQQHVNDVKRHVETGDMTPIVSSRGVVGYQPSSGFLKTEPNASQGTQDSGTKRAHKRGASIKEIR
jgi:hypothetical protein